MTSVAVLIPVKSSRVKSRLSDVLSEGQRQEFARLLLTDLLGVLRKSGLLPVTYVVSSDKEILELAQHRGANAIPEPQDMGVNSAVIRGMTETRHRGVFLVLPSDLPLLRPTEVKDFLGLRAAGLDVAIAPSGAFDGTNALTFSPGAIPDLSYDDNSFWNHITSSARKGLRLAVCCKPGLMFDVDTPKDFRALARARLNRESVEFARRVNA